MSKGERTQPAVLDALEADDRRLMPLAHTYSQ
jgi:hypothetical protein